MFRCRKSSRLPKPVKIIDVSEEALREPDTINKPNTATGVLSQKDAGRFAEACREYTKGVTRSCEATRKALQELGTHDAHGNLTERYR